MSRALTFLIALALPTVAFAAGGSEVPHQPEGWFMGLAFHTFNLALFIGVVVYFARSMISDSLKNRAAQIGRDLEESNRLRREAQARYDEFEARLNRFEAEFDEMRSEAVRSTEREVALIEDRATTEVAQIKDGAQKAIRDEVQAARTALHQQAVVLAMQVAEEQLRSRVTGADQDRLAQELLGSMKEANAHG